ncbi:hypothetical protein ANCDUO_13687 [Ancylostoma duodenale]|uniref:Uncharacterized protein n=1 Tax=Ancylostoma duodenale TaxID=51022 RepID=A0A0C2GGA4_9BILA|nr:hypothetical protein ANCDUO_13687 [Ancylostoma duodenale]
MKRSNDRVDPTNPITTLLLLDGKNTYPLLSPELDLTPLAGVSQFMSEDNLASAECGTPAYRTPSYIRVSCALSGYTKYGILIFSEQLSTDSYLYSDLQGI